MAADCGYTPVKGSAIDKLDNETGPAREWRVLTAQQVDPSLVTDTVASEDRLRAQLYRLLGTLLGAAPAADVLDAVAALGGDQSGLGRAIDRLAREAAVADPAAIASQYQQIFIGLGRGELVPFASYYLTGFLHEKPLARLREDMAALGVERNDGVVEPEDHIASVLELMAGVIDGTLAQAGDVDAQRRLFEAHVGSWAPYFFRDLAAVSSSPFHAALGAVGAELMEIEARAFELT